jgi:hypothetical protein
MQAMKAALNAGNDAAGSALIAAFADVGQDGPHRHFRFTPGLLVQLVVEPVFLHDD